MIVMVAQNIFLNKLSETTLRVIKSRSDFICVFISHQRADKEICRKIVDYLVGAGIYVYFDENDEDLKIANQTQNQKAVTKAILKGINHSTHMLCVISPNTLDSKWVPFEVGYGYDKTELGILLLKGVKKELLPSYIRAVDLIIPDIWDLNLFIAQIVKTPELLLESTNRVKNYNDLTHPLSNVMERILTI
jgi:hypothetical protein